MFKVGDLVKVDASELPHIGIPAEEVGGILVVNDVITERDRTCGQPIYEVRNSDGDYFGLLGNALVSV